MSPILFALVLASIFTALIVFFFRPYDYGAGAQRINRIGGSENDREKSAETRWRSVKIRPGLISCSSVSNLSDQVFLSKEVPTLPLEYCTEKNCTCHYLFLDDRRSGLDRRAELAKLKGMLPTFDRRHSPGRRMDDLALV